VYVHKGKEDLRSDFHASIALAFLPLDAVELVLEVTSEIKDQHLLPVIDHLHDNYVVGIQPRKEAVEAKKQSAAKKHVQEKQWKEDVESKKQPAAKKHVQEKQWKEDVEPWKLRSSELSRKDYTLTVLYHNTGKRKSAPDLTLTFFDTMVMMQCPIST
jgi:hypothetical protein